MIMDNHTLRRLRALSASIGVKPEESSMYTSPYLLAAPWYLTIGPNPLHRVELSGFWFDPLDLMRRAYASSTAQTAFPD